MKTKLDKFQHRILNTLLLEERPGTKQEFPEELHADLREFLHSQGIVNLYSHQCEMFTSATAGNHTIITTATASGKTLAFLLPVVQKILADPVTRALFVYPTKALAHDQYRNLEPVLDYFGSAKIQAGIYDGDTPPNERSRIRREAHIILTNPEMVNGAFLPNHALSGFNDVFSKLRFVIIDELHVYRGAFGSHMSNVMRRLQRVCKYYKSSPQFLLSSATIANPAELASDICHEAFTHIDKDGAPQSQKKIVIWQPPYVGDSPYRKKPEEEASELIPDLVEQGDRFITFCKSRREVEVVLKEARDKLSHLENQPTLGRDLSDKVSGYRGGYTKLERKRIEKRLAQGHLRGVISTNALELGIDIGDLDVAIVCGFPSTRASFWQQVGRAGRQGREALAILILDVGSIDQYIAIHSQFLIDSGVENAVVDKDNLFIQLAHIRAAAAELPLTLEDASQFPDIGEIIPVLLQAGELSSEYGNFHWCGGEYPAGDFNLRNISRDTYKVINQQANTMITEMDESQAFHEVYPKAIYIHDGMQYMVEELDLDNRIARVFPIEVDYFTVPFVETDVAVIKEFQQREVARTNIVFGDVRVRETVPGYKMVQFHNHQNMGYESIKLSLVQKLETEGIWFHIPVDVAQIFDTHGAYNFYRGLQHALLNGTMMRTMSTREDISATFFTTVEEGGHTKKSHILLYDLYPGGLGFTEKAYELAREILDDAISLVAHCKCEDGCPACVGDYHLDRQVVRWGLESLLRQTTPPEDIQVNEDPPRLRQPKLFSLEQLPASWQQYVAKLSENGEKIAEFFTRIERVEVHGSILHLCLSSNFLGQWMLDPSNKRKIENTIRYYVDVPNGFSIDVVAIEENSATIEKVMRRYDDLKGLQ